MDSTIIKNFFDHVQREVSFLILDYNRPAETKACLESIKKNVDFPHYVILYSNAGQQDYIIDFYNNNLIDIAILSKTNDGSSIGTIRMVEICPTPYFINLQNDNFLKRPISLEEIKEMKNQLDKDEIGAIGLARLADNRFSERAFMMKTQTYLSIKGQTGYGTGPTQNPNFKNSEQVVDAWLTDFKKTLIQWQPDLIVENGRYAVLEIGGGVLKRRCDTQELKVLKTPTFKAPAFNLSDSEWEDILTNKWEDWRIPEASKYWIFMLNNDGMRNAELDKAIGTLKDDNAILQLLNYYYNNTFENPKNVQYIHSSVFFK